jgi:hypothetical protein
MATEITEEYTDSAELVEQTPEAVEAAPVEIPTDPHEPAYWAYRRQHIAEQVAGMHSRPIEQLSQAERDRFSTVLWNEFWPLFGLVEKLYTEKEAPKPARQRRARVPKAALPTLGSAEVIANEA